ncbi:MAG: hypothetical protein ONB24_04215 [candidate division KSB1 bacterium]|nr:hypothetical protein [candidate division KSB1 bacterium]
MIKRMILGAMLLGNAAWCAVGADGGYAGAFLRMGFEARSKSLGDAFVAVPEGAGAGVYNPGALPQLSGPQLMMSLSFLPLDRSLDFVGFALPIRPQSGNSGARPLNAGLMVGWLHAGVDHIDGRDFAGNRTQELSNSEHAFFMGFAVAPSERLSFGVSGKILYNRIPDIAEEGGALTSRGLGIDFGVFFRAMSGLTFGAAVKNNMAKYTWNTDKVYERGTSTTYALPRTLRVGAAWRIPQQWLLVVADVESSDKQNPRYHFGAEATLHRLAAVRLGLDHGKPTFGFGVRSRLFGKQAELNYAFVPTLEALSPDHVFSWTIDF